MYNLNNIKISFLLCSGKGLIQGKRNKFQNERHYIMCWKFKNWMM